MTERELIRSIRREIEALPCRCKTMEQGRVCERCYLLRVVDNGLVEIGQNDEEMMADDGYKDGAVVKTL